MSTDASHCTKCGENQRRLRRLINGDFRQDLCPVCFSEEIFDIVINNDQAWFSKVIDKDGPEECYELE